MLDTSRVTEELRAARAYADSIGLCVQLEVRLALLDTYALPTPTRCVLYPHPAPYSFSFAMRRETRSGEWSPWFDGAVLYHGAHDRYGKHPYPPFPSPADKTLGWTIYRCPLRIPRPLQPERAGPRVRARSSFKGDSVPHDTRPRYHVLQSLELTADRFHHIRVGTAYQNPDGTIDAFLDLIVVGHRFRLRPYAT
jgi:hypothetical protein